jgi:phage terminase large subunit
MPLNVGDFLASAVSPEEIDTFKILGYEPHARQKIFHEYSRGGINRILLGGAASGGKTSAMIQDAIWFAMNYPKIRIGMHRKSYPELDESLIRELANWDYARKLGGKWNKTAKSLTFPNGSGIFFKFAETLLDASKIQGGEYNLWYFDESSLTDPRVIQRLEERLRSRTPLIPVFGSRAGSNPGGIGAQYYKDTYIKPTDYGRKIHEVVVGEGDYQEIHKYAFIWSRIDDNPYVDAGYKATLMAIPDPARRAAMLNGDWDVSEGAFFTQFSRVRHVIPKEDTFNIPVEWQRYAGIDYGIHDAWAVLWIALDNNARMWAYREYCLSDVMAPQQAQLILAAEVAAKETSVVHVADPSMWGQRGTPYSIADIYGLEGVGLLKANNDRVVGWSLCHERLNEGPICEYHQYQKDLGLWHENTCPMFHVFESACPNFIETIPALPRDDIRPDDAKTRNVEDHMADAWRYVNMYAGHFARPLFYEDYTPPTAQQILERMNDQPAVDYSQPMKTGMSSQDFIFPTDLNNPSSRGGW